MTIIHGHSDTYLIGENKTCPIISYTDEAMLVTFTVKRAEDEINVPIALSAFRDKSCEDSPTKGLYNLR